MDNGNKCYTFVSVKMYLNFSKNNQEKSNKKFITRNYKISTLRFENTTIIMFHSTLPMSYLQLYTFPVFKFGYLFFTQAVLVSLLIHSYLNMFS